MLKNISRLKLSRPATLLVVLMIFAAFPAAVAAQTFTVVNQAPERVNVPFDRRVLVELPATFLAAETTDWLYFQFPTGVTVKATGYQTLEPAFVNTTGTAETVDSRTGRIPVLGSGNAGKGLIVLSFQGITAGQTMADLAVEFFGPPGSVFSAARISLTGGSPPTPEPEENNQKGDREETPIPLGSFTIGEKQWIFAGETRTMDVTPFLTEDRVFCPVRFAALLIGIPEQNIRWEPQTRTVTLTKGETTVILQAGSREIKVNGATTVMDVSPVIAPAGRLMLPLGWIVNPFGYQAKWEPASQTVSLYEL